MTANIYLILILALMIMHWLIELWVDLLNVGHADPTVPSEFADCYDAERYAKSQRYLRDTTRIGLIQSTLMLVLTIGFILLGGFSWLHTTAVTIAPNTTIWQGLVFGGLLALIGQLVSLPFSIVNTFIIEARYGFNRTTVRTFLADFLKGLLLLAVIGGPVFALVIWLFEVLPYAWLWAWAALSVIQIFLMVIAPVWLLPLFNKFTPLEPGELRDALEAYAKGQHYRLSGIFKIDGSRRSTHSNAYFTGIGRTKRIALFDTLIDQHTTEELTAVLAHEVGHCKLGHVRTGLVISMLSSLLMFGILALFITQPGLYGAFGITTEPLPVYAGLVFFGFLYAPVSFVLGLLGNALSRRHEFAADAFAARTTRRPDTMMNALKQLSVHNLSNLTPHPLKVMMDYSHPPVLQRIHSLRNVDGEDV